MSPDLYDLKPSADFPMMEYIFTLSEKSDNINDVINLLLRRLGEYYHFDCIIVKEILDSDTVKVTYEWEVSGHSELLNIERRFLSEIVEILHDFFIEKKNSSMISYPDEINKHIAIEYYNKIQSIVTVPLIKNNSISGVVEFISYSDDKVYDEILLRDLRSFANCLVSYLLSMRELNIYDKTIKSLSEIDPVTDLPKYEVFQNAVQQVVNEESTGSAYSIEFISLDFTNFKYLNEKYGYIEGNHLLQEFARQIYNTSDKIISCSRAYSDNFIIAVRYDDNCSYDRSRKVIESSGLKVLDWIREKYINCNLIINIGVYFMKAGDKDYETAITYANLARKCAKQSKPSLGIRCMLYNAGMSIAARKQTEYIESMSRSMQNNDFFVQFQPVCTTDSFDIIGAEALVRWKKDDRIVLYPDEFISIFEKSGQIIKLDYFVLKQVFAYLEERVRMNLTVVPISVNISLAHFENTELPLYVGELLNTYKINPQLVEFEFTEQIYTLDENNVRTILSEIKRMGFKIFIDNFGIGYSSLNALLKFNIDGVKLDRRFMKRELEDKDKAIISCVINMCNRLNLQIVCVGIESESQLNFVNECFGPYFQGKYFSLPVDKEQLDFLISEQ